MEANQQQSPQLPEEPLGPLVTVVVVSYFKGAALRRAITAIEKSHLKDRLQTIVLDPGTHDTTPSWDIEHPNITFLRMPRNFGATKASNIGLRSAKGEMVLFLDPSVELQPDAIEKLVQALEAMPDAGAVAPLLTSKTGEPLPQLRKLPDRDTMWKLWQDPDAQPASPVSGSDPVVNEYPGRKALLTRLSFLKGMNYFDESYGEWGSELELAFQIRHAGKKAYVIPSATAIDHTGEDRAPQWNNGQQATFAADRLNGVAHFVGRRAGFLPETLLRIQAVLTVGVRAITFQNPGYNWPLFTSLLGGQKIDGSQGSV